MKASRFPLFTAAATAVLALSSSAFAATLYWDGGASSANNQSDNTTTTGQNWLSGGNWDNGTTSAPVASWTSGDSAIFGGSAASQTITAGTLTVGNMTFGSGAAGTGTSGTAYTITGGAITLGTSTIATNTNTAISTVLSGSSGSLTKEGAGTLTLTGANTYSGTTNVNNGTIIVNGSPGYSTNGSRIGNNVVVNSGATLRTDNDHQFGWTGTLANLTVNSGGTFNQNSRNHYVNTLTLNGNASLTNGTGKNIGLSGGAVTYTGTGAQQTTVASGLQLQNISGTAVTSTFTINGTNTAGDLIVSGAIQNAGGLTKEGTGTLVLFGTNTYSGTTTINAGTLIVNGTAGFTTNGSRVGNNVVVNNAATLRTDNAHQFGWTGTLANLTVNNGGTFDQNNNDQYIGTLTLNGNATLSNGAGKYLALSGGAVTYTGTGSQQTTVATGLRLRNVPGAAVNATFTVNGTNAAGDLVVSGAIQEGGGLTKTGTGTLVLSAANTYTGATAVNAGKLLVSGSLAASAVTVTGTDTVLATDAVASFGSSLTINSGAILAVGDTDAVGLATATGSTTFNTGSIFSWNLAGTPSETGRGSNYDALNTASLGSTTGAIFRVIVDGTQDFSESFWSTNGQWTDIFQNGGTNLDFANIFSGGVQYYNRDGAVSNVPSTQGAFTMTGNTLTWSAVPEPTSALAGLLLSAGLLRRRRTVR